MSDRHPMQPIVLDGAGTPRFKSNAIVRYLFDARRLDLNEIGAMPFPDADREQIAQLLGYSVSGYGDLHYADPRTVAAADRKASALLRGKEYDMADPAHAVIRIEVREDVAEWIAAEVLAAYRAGAEAMRERCAREADAYAKIGREHGPGEIGKRIVEGSMLDLARDLRALPLDPPATGEESVK